MKIITLICLFSLPFKLLFAQDYGALQQLFDDSKVLKKHFYGFSLLDMDKQQFVFGQQEDMYFTPASNTKVFTLFTALTQLPDSIPGIAYCVRGDSLLFWGTGDPTFLHPQLDNGRVYSFLKNSGKQLFYIPERAVQEPYYRNGWSIEDYDEYYQPEITTFPIYGNVAQFSEQHGQLRVVPASFQDAVVLSNTAAHPSYSLQREMDRNLWLASSASVPNSYKRFKPFKQSNELLVALLQDTLQLSVKMINYEKPADLKVLYSLPTDTVLREMMLPSDNFLAEQLNMMAAFMKYGSFQTATLRQEMARDYYQHFTDTVVLRDGSGLSTYNKVTPRAMVELLQAIDKQCTDASQLHQYFPAGGVDGTLKNAYKLDRGDVFVWAKTGTINAVHCQSGYILTRQGRRLAFSFQNNNYISTAGPVRREMVRIISYIRENY